MFVDGMSFRQLKYCRLLPLLLRLLLRLSTTTAAAAATATAAGQLGRLPYEADRGTRVLADVECGIGLRTNASNTGSTQVHHLSVAIHVATSTPS